MVCSIAVPPLTTLPFDCFPIGAVVIKRAFLHGVKHGLEYGYVRPYHVVSHNVAHEKDNHKQYAAQSYPKSFFAFGALRRYGRRGIISSAEAVVHVSVAAVGIIRRAVAVGSLPGSVIASARSVRRLLGIAQSLPPLPLSF